MTSKEELRQQRKEAYQMAKAKRDADPAYQAMKEKAKDDRKAAYRALRDKHRDAKREEKRKRIAEKDALLMALVFKASELTDLSS